MTEIHTLSAARQCLDVIEENGFSVRQVANVPSIQIVLDKIGKEYLTPAMSPFFNDFTETSSFWLLLEKDNGPCAALACRFDDLGHTTIDDFWRSSMQRYYGNCRTPQIGKISSIISHSIKGRVAYFGDLIIQKDTRGSRSLLHAFAVLAQIISHTKWNPDWHYAFISDRHASLGAQHLYGFCRGVRFAQEWLDPPGTRGSHECCVYSERSEVIDLIKALSFHLSSRQ